MFTRTLHSLSNLVFFKGDYFGLRYFVIIIILLNRGWTHLPGWHLAFCSISVSKHTSSSAYEKAL